MITGETDRRHSDRGHMNASGADPAQAEKDIEAQAGGAELLDTPILKLAEQLTPRDIIRIANEAGL